jgi:recombination protein RecA
VAKLAPKLVPAPERAGAYFTKPSERLEFLPTGCTTLNCALGGGWVFGRMANIVGDKSTAKTGLAIEACANFVRMFPGEIARYREAEGAFEEGYGGAMGMPTEQVRFWRDDYPDRLFETIEDLFEDLDAVLDATGNSPSLYIVDSLDALSDREELARPISNRNTEGDKEKGSSGSYNLGKQRKLGELFRRLVRRIEASRMCLLIISQVRDNIGVSFGEKHKRTGGKSMDFYASHTLWLSHLETVKRKVKGVERAVGIRIKARCKKNKVGLPFRESEFEYLFGYGIDDLGAMLEWLISVKRLGDLLSGKAPTLEDAKEFLKETECLGDDEYRAACADVATIVRAVWSEIEASFMPVRSKYGAL